MPLQSSLRRVPVYHRSMSSQVPTTVSPANQIRETVLETAVTATTAPCGALAGAAAGETIGGDVAAASLGPVAAPLGQYVGRNTLEDLFVQIAAEQEVTFHGTIFSLRRRVDS